MKKEIKNDKREDNNHNADSSEFSLWGVDCRVINIVRLC